MIRAFYITTPEAVDRQDSIEAQLQCHGFSFSRVVSTRISMALGFQNRAVRGCWEDHERAISNCVAMSACIFEDDALILDYTALKHAFDTVPDDWQMLYFYGGTSRNPQRVRAVNDTHAYAVNSSFARKLHAMMLEARLNIHKTLPKNHSTYNDQWMQTIHPTIKVYAVAQCVSQQRDRFKSQTGWGWGGKPPVFED